jgi:penicillin-binding protein 1C
MSPRLALAAIGLAAAAGAAAASAWIARPLPAGLLAADPSPGLVLLDRQGRELRRTRSADGSRRAWVPLSEMDPDLIAAFLAVEDRRFYRHAGVDPRAAARSARANLRARRIVSGGSTVTMQLARMLRPLPRSWWGKLRQSLWAVRLERHLGKQAILEQYLNRVPLGQGAEGVDAAAALYFDAGAGELSLGQAATLAGLARSPSTDNPFVSPARAAARRAVALGGLRSVGYADAADAARAAAEPLGRPGRPAAFLAPHFTTRVVGWAERAGRRPAGEWRTSLDLALQEELDAEVRHTVGVLGTRGVRHAAAVVLDNGSGEILAWVGSPDFWADTAGQVDMVVSPRQPGSALKPFLYALALDRGYTPATILPDVAKIYQTATGPYAPRNYDRRFHGPVRVREALASSYNLPAVELADRLGAARLLQVLRRAGFTSLNRSAEFYGLGLALGNGDVTLLELANGYRALANGGVWRPWRWRLGAAAEPAEPGVRIAGGRSAALVLDILADPAARVPGFGLGTPLDFPFPVAAKTGTSRHFTDNWAVAAAGRFTVAVWVGNFSGRPMDGVSGVSGAGPLLHRAVLATARRYDPGTLPAPQASGAVPATICRLSGLRAGAACPTATEWFAPGSEPVAGCDWHRGGAVALPAEYADWAGARAEPDPPAARTEVSAAPADGGFRIVSPLDGDLYRVPPGADSAYATVALRAVGGATGPRVRWFVDGRPHPAGRWPLTSGSHRVRAVSPAGETAEAAFRVE